MLILAVCLRLARPERHRALNGEKVGQQRPEQHQHQTAVDEMDANLGSGPAEAADVGGEEIGEQDKNDQVSSRKDRPSPRGIGPADQHALEIAPLNLMKTAIHLGESSDKNQHQGRRETDHRELQRGENLQQAMHQGLH